MHSLHPQQLYEIAKYRMDEELAQAERRRLVQLALHGRPKLRARAARKLFEAAVALESEETWRIVWERLQASGRL
jgi:hypothetical protein